MTTATRGTDCKPSGVVSSAVARVEATQFKHRSGGERPPQPVAVECKQFRSADTQAARRFFVGAYRPGWRLSGLAGHCAVSHRRRDTGTMTVDELAIQGERRSRFRRATPSS